MLKLASHRGQPKRIEVLLVEISERELMLNKNNE
jgi:hypothetical protein